ncbi:MAG: MJ1255/VC2487 family glycosyltransferase [Nanoarchaeota archaeon]
MVKILYGIGGQGMGHATRSLVVIEELQKNNEVSVITGDRPYAFLHERFKNVSQIKIHKIHTLHQKYKEDQTYHLGTVASNIKSFPKYTTSFRKVRAAVKSFKPDLIITDFEPFTAMIANQKRMPLLSIDNQHIMVKTSLQMRKSPKQEALATKMVVRSFVPRADEFIITTFFYPKKVSKHAHLVPPILRKQILNARPKQGTHVLVYQTSQTNMDILKTLMKTDQKYIVYGYGAKGLHKNLMFKAFNEKGFFSDLSSAKAVITNGGFSLMSEAIALHKPVLSQPLKKDFEQFINSYFLQKCRYGKMSETVDKKSLNRFFDMIPKYQSALKEYTQEGNKELFKKLYAWITLRT